MGTPLLERRPGEPRRATLRLSEGVNLLAHVLGPYAAEVLQDGENAGVVRLQRGFYHGGEQKIFRGKLKNQNRFFVVTEVNDEGAKQTDVLTNIIIFYPTGAVRIYNPQTREQKNYFHVVGTPPSEEPLDEIKRDLNFGQPDFIQQFRP